MRDRNPPEPGAEEPASLMRQQGQPEQGREIAHSKQLADHPRGGRHVFTAGAAQLRRHLQ